MNKALIGLAALLCLAACGQKSETQTAAPAAAGAECGGGEGVVVSDVWVRAASEGQPTTAAYFTLCNAGDEEDALTGVATDDASAAELHESMTDSEGMTSMTPVESVSLPAGETVVFAPGGYHVMLIGVKEAIPAGGEVPLTLSFKNAPAQTVNATARALGDMGGMKHQH